MLPRRQVLRSRGVRQRTSAGATSSSGRPRRAATSSGRCSSFNAATVACTTLIALSLPATCQDVVHACTFPARARATTGDRPLPGLAGRNIDAGRSLPLNRVDDRPADPAERGRSSYTMLPRRPLAIAAGTSFALP